MSILQSSLDTRSEAYQQNRAQMLALVEGFRTLEATVRAHGEAVRGKFEQRGQLTPRERVARLLDPGSPFLELSTLAGYKMHDDNGRKDTLGGGNITGIGFVSGVRCMVSANDSAIKGGSIAPMGLQKSLRAQRIAQENKLPCIGLVESGGANLNYQSELFVEGGKIFCQMARTSAMGIPQITVVHGSSTAGGAYLPGLSDYVIVVRGRAKIFLAGPPLVKAAIGEETTDEELGGAQMHAEISGLAEYLAEDDAHGIRIARELLASLGWNDNLRTTAPRSFAPPRYDIDEVCGLVPPDPRIPWDIRELIARMVDGSEFLEFKALWGTDTVCGHAAIEGWPCGIVANAGPIMPDGSCKAAQFIQLCCQADIPIIYLQNTTGYMVGREVEQRGAIKHGAKMIQAVANATVPQLTLLIGGGYGAGNYGMCGRAFDPRFIFAWPNSKVAVMGAEQIGMVMELITKAKFSRPSGPGGAATDHMLDDAARKVRDDNIAMMRDTLVKRIESESTALFATARLWDDGIIDPRDSRRVLAMALATCREARDRTLAPNTFGIARM
jgi:geranyl-CoA carboxylase beta subunit